jgi:cell division protein FtsI (penicillin-binding protein 3)
LTDFIEPDKIRQLDAIEKQLDNQRQKSSKRLTKGEVMPNIDGVIWTPHTMRRYPEHTLAANVLGFFASRERETGHGYFGVEEKYNQLLAGNPVTSACRSTRT